MLFFFFLEVCTLGVFTLVVAKFSVGSEAPPKMHFHSYGLRLNPNLSHKVLA